MKELQNLLHDTGDVEIVRSSLTSMKDALNMAAYDYAYDALTAAQKACEAAIQKSPCSVVWPHILDYQELAQKTQETMNVCSTSVAMLLNVEETGNTEIDKLNAQVHLNSLQQHIISAMLEGANTRAQLALMSMPENPAPGTRCNPNRIRKDTPPNDGT